MIETESLLGKSPSPAIATPVRATALRWYVGALFCFMTVMHGLAWFTFSSVPDPSQEYYRITPSEIDLLLNWGSIAFIVALPVAAWLATLRGAVKITVVAGSLFILFGCAIRIVPTLVGARFRTTAVGHLFLHAGQISIALAGPLTFATPSRMALEFFPEEERTRATSAVMIATTLSEAIGFVLGPFLASTAETVPRLLYVELALSIPLAAAALIYFPSSPAVPPSAVAAVKNAERSSASFAQVAAFFREVVGAMKNPSLVLLVVAGGGIIGMEIAWEGMLPQVLSPYFGLSTSGWLGFGAMISGMLTCGLTGMAIDKWFRRRMLLVILVEEALGLLAFGWLMLSLPGPFWTAPLLPSGIVPVALAMVAVGGLQSAPYGLWYELAAELSYPVDEGISAALISCISSATSILCLSTFPLLPIWWVNFLCTVLSAAFLLVAAFVHERYPRVDLESRAKANAEDVPPVDTSVVPSINTVP